MTSSALKCCKCNSQSVAGTCCVTKSNGRSKSSDSVATTIQDGDGCQSLASLQETGEMPVRLHSDLMSDFLFFSECTALVCVQCVKEQGSFQGKCIIHSPLIIDQSFSFYWTCRTQATGTEGIELVEIK